MSQCLSTVTLLRWHSQCLSTVTLFHFHSQFLSTVTLSHWHHSVFVNSHTLSLAPQCVCQQSHSRTDTPTWLNVNIDDSQQYVHWRVFFNSPKYTDTPVVFVNSRKYRLLVPQIVSEQSQVIILAFHVFAYSRDIVLTFCRVRFQQVSMSIFSSLHKPSLQTVEQASSRVSDSQTASK